MRKLDITQTLAGLHPEELSLMLLGHFGRSQGSERVMTYSRQDGGPLLELRLNKRRLVDGLYGYDGFTNEDATELEAHIGDALAADRGVSVAQAVLFSQFRCAGAIRIGNKVQLSPLPDDAPQAQYGVDLHPLLLEVAFAASSNAAVAEARARAATREVGLLFATLLNSDITLEPPPVVGWAHPVLSNVSTEVQTGYRWPGRRYPIAEAFSSLAGYAPMPLDELEAHDGWTQARAIGSDLRLPISLPTLVDGYLRLAEEPRILFQRASYWLHHARRVWPLSRSDSFLATARAIEALMPEPAAGETCDGCGRTTQPGSTRQFSEFVERFAGGEIPVKQRRDYYRLRSALTHGGKLLEAEFSMPGAGSFGMDLGQVSALREVARAVLYNWLREQVLALYEVLGRDA